MSILKPVLNYLDNRNRYLAVVFIVYLAFLFGFAGVYRALYARDRGSFAFNSEILVAQGLAVKTAVETEIYDDTIKLEQVRYLVSYIGNPNASVQFGKWYDNYYAKVYGDTYQYECSPRFVGGGGPTPPAYILT